jgi:hypothetical protein
VIQAEEEVVQLHEAAGRPRDFGTLYEDEHRRLFPTVYSSAGADRTPPRSVPPMRAATAAARSCPRRVGSFAGARDEPLALRPIVKQLGEQLAIVDESLTHLLRVGTVEVRALRGPARSSVMFDDARMIDRDICCALLEVIEGIPRSRITSSTS